MREFGPVAHILRMGILMTREGNSPAQIPVGPGHLSHSPGIFLILAGCLGHYAHGPEEAAQ